MMTLGEYRIGFYGDDNPHVAAIKLAAAEFIDMVDSLKYEDESSDGELARLKALALSHIEDAAMWAVKAATKQRFVP